MKVIEGGLDAAPGVLTAGVHAGFKKRKKDLALIYFPEGATIAGVFTKNLIKGAPLKHAEALLKINSYYQAIMINSGNANACTGEQGMDDVQEMTKIASRKLGIEARNILVSSTGVIGERLDLSPLEKGIEQAVSQLDSTSSTTVAEAILTTDKMTKELSYEVMVGGHPIHIGGIAKGSGMIHPNMATMLGYITTDLSLEQDQLYQALLQAAEQSFNSITVDGDTSPNDTVLLCSTNKVDIEVTEPIIQEFTDALTKICQELSQMIVKDGEGATKFVEVKVNNAGTEEDAIMIAKSVATSNLVKTALYGEDANWGRVISAIGVSGIGNIDPEAISISFTADGGSVLVCQNGIGLDFDEDAAKKLLSNDEIDIEIDLNVGKESASVWTCDMTTDYIKINSDYRS